MILCFSVLCVLDSKNSSVWYKYCLTQQNSWKFVRPPKWPLIKILRNEVKKLPTQNEHPQSKFLHRCPGQKSKHHLSVIGINQIKIMSLN